MQLFSIIQWHHFAYMIISLALLGYGASGSFLALASRRLLAHYPLAYISNLVLFSLSIVSCYLLAQQIPFNPEEVLWDSSQILRLSGVYLLLALPFFFAANSIGLSLTYHHRNASRLYAADLIGAGLGSLGIVLLLYLLFPNQALLLLGSLGALTAAVAWLELGLKPRPWAMLAILIALLPFTLPASWTELNISPYKGLNQLLQISGTRIAEQRSSPLGLISVVESPMMPLRHAPGLSLNATVEPPSQLGVFTDADNMTVITAYPDKLEKLSYLDQMTSALPYHLVPVQKLLVLGAGGGSDILQARYNGVKDIDAVELNPQLIELLQKNYRTFSGDLYGKENLHIDFNIYADEARGFVTKSSERYDLIQLSLLDSFSASSAGLYALNESYLYTVEALQTYLRRLKPDGMLAISRWIKLPPRDGLKLFATAIKALQKSGVNDVSKQLILIRGWQTSTLLIKNGTFTPGEISSLLEFCKKRSFDVAYYPGIPESATNKYNILQQPYFYLGTQALLGDNSEHYQQQYKFNLRPATDDRPYFFHFFKWPVLAEILDLRGQGGMPLLEFGYLILIVTLGQALLVSLVLILLPLLFYRRNSPGARQNINRFSVGSYFFILGLAFLFIEIAFIQKFILFLHHPIYAIAVVLAAFLIFAGCGSAWSRALAEQKQYAKGVKLAVAAVVTLGMLYLFILGPIFDALMNFSDVSKILVSLLLIAPMAFFMGVPFPLGLARLGETAAGYIPWVWGVNGCASVLSAVLATLLAIHYGFTMVIMSALLLYGLALISFSSRWDLPSSRLRGSL